MAKMTRQQYIQGIHDSLKKISPEVSTDIEKAKQHEQVICDAFGMKPSAHDAWGYCPGCNRVTCNNECIQCG